MARKIIDLLKQKYFGKWEVLEFVGIQSVNGGGALWRCRCKCGREKVHKSGNLRSGATTQCRNCHARGRLGRNHKEKARQEKAKKLKNLGKSFAEIGEELGVSRQRAHQLVNS